MLPAIREKANEHGGRSQPDVPVHQMRHLPPSPQGGGLGGHLGLSIPQMHHQPPMPQGIGGWFVRASRFGHPPDMESATCAARWGGGSSLATPWPPVMEYTPQQCAAEYKYGA